jgi:type I restriction enzyme R subunit
VLHRYELKQLTSAAVVERLVEIAKQLRDARHRHEQLGLSEEEAAFYDALAGGVEDVKADPELAKIAHELVEGIRTDLTVDWAEREATEARIRAKIKRLLRKHRYRPPKRKPDVGGGGASSTGFNDAAQLVLDQAKALYRYWPDVEVGDRLFA